MLKSMTVVNPAGESTKLVLMNPWESGFNVWNIEGLGPGVADINTVPVATNDGSVYNSARVQSREIVLTVKFVDFPTIEDARQRSYRFFPIKKRVLLIFETTNHTIEIYGYVQSNEPVIFAQEEHAQITILCPFPYFRLAQPSLVLFFEVEQLFEFPFTSAEDYNDAWLNPALNQPTNPEITTNDNFHRDRYTEPRTNGWSNEGDFPNTEGGEFRDESLANIRYDGDADTGVVITVHATGEASGLMIAKVFTDGTPPETIRIDSTKLIAITGKDIQPLDDIIISTEKGNKYAILRRDGVDYNILNALDRNSKWPQLTTGDNLFTYVADSGYNNLQLNLEFYKLFEGV